MRKETNLDPYYKRMKLEEINRLSTMMGDMQYEAQRWQSLMKYDEFRLERPDDWEWTKSLRRMDISRAAQSIDRYMISIGQESLFGMEEKARRDFTDDDIRKIAIRALWLKEKPKTEEECRIIEEEQRKKDALLKEKIRAGALRLKNRLQSASLQRTELAIQKAEMAVAILEGLTGVDPMLAAGITMGMELAAAPFAAEDKEFFAAQSIAEDPVMIGMMLTVDMLNGLADERKERIAVGVGAVLRNARILTEEEKAAKLAHQIFAEPDTQAEPEQIVQDRVRVLEQVKKATIEAGTVTAAE